MVAPVVCDDPPLHKKIFGVAPLHPKLIEMSPPPLPVHKKKGGKEREDKERKDKEKGKSASLSLLFSPNETFDLICGLLCFLAF